MSQLNKLNIRTRLIFSAFIIFFITAFQTLKAEEANVIINCKSACKDVMDKVINLGGTVTNKYQNIDAFSATMDSAIQAELFKINSAIEVSKDNIVSLPDIKDRVDLSKDANVEVMQGQMLDDFLATDLPNDYEYNNLLTGAVTMNNAGYSGQGVVVAVIDTGTANNAAVVPALDGSVIGGENFVPGGGEPGATSTLNYPHGTNVGTMIAGHAYFLFNSASTFAQSVNSHLPNSIIYEYLPGLSVIPMFGSAPDASLYALKVFPATGAGAPESRIIAAMDRAITMRQNYNNGMPSNPVNAGCGAEDDPCVYDSLKIDIVNMSLGGGTLYAGNDLEDQLTEAMLDVGITLVTSAGNEGFTAITGGSPGTGKGSLTVGAASVVGNERVLRDLQYGLGIGELYRPSSHHQMATFSSRGPSADGRISTDVVANGFACFMQNANGGLSVGSGTSFSSPMVAGAAAVLRGAFPGATAAQIRNALVAAANPNILGDNSAAIDQGAGFIDIPASYGLLFAGSVDSSLPQGFEHKLVESNVTSLGMTITRPRSGQKSKSLSGLMPGHVEHVFIESREDTDSITIDFTNIVPELPAAEQNLFFGDDIYYQVQDASTHNELILASGFVTGDSTIVIQKPQTGLVRLAIMGDWTNAGRVSVDVAVSEIKMPKKAVSATDNVAQDDSQIVELDIPDGLSEVTFELSWKNNWSIYPTDDIDLILFDPSSNVDFSGATFLSPERVVVSNPQAGVWTALIQGYTVHGVNLGPDSKWTLRVYDQDGNKIYQL